MFKIKISYHRNVSRQCTGGCVVTLLLYFQLYSAFFLLFLSLSSHSTRYLMNVMTKRSYRTLLIPHISWEKVWSIDRPGGIDVSSLCIQTSLNEQHHVITSFKEALCSDHSQRVVRSLSSSLLFLSPDSWKDFVMKQIYSSRLQ